MHFLLFPEVGGLSLRAGGLLRLDGTVGHHVGGALAEVALLGLGWELAFLGMVIQATAVVASGERNQSGVSRSRLSFPWIRAHARTLILLCECPQVGHFFLRWLLICWVTGIHIKTTLKQS